MCVLTPLYRQTLCLTLPPAIGLMMTWPCLPWALITLPLSHLPVLSTLPRVLQLAISRPQDVPILTFTFRFLTHRLQTH
ncbi:hypothetical protein AMELA_G00072430 [Ameiurus melas]|uniref:Uncharacterized protein n=1 Tax=Ameiurus melas TaxID=219545 RepID=A0A7J6AXL6_AMEME|nr:hypothetical protein AMELA_G00072430 [Ameiurus melas]